MWQILVTKILSLLAEPVPLVEAQWLNVTFDVPILVDITTPLTPTLVLIYSVECVLILFGMLLMPYFTHFINSSGLIHRNLQHLFVLFTTVYILASITRFYMIAVQFKIVTDLNTPYFLLAGLIRLEHYGMGLSVVLVVTLERALATYYVTDYEAKRRNWVAVLCSAVSFVYTQFFAIPICFFKAPLYYIILYSSLWAVFAIIILSGLRWYNDRELRRLSWKVDSLQTTVTYTLSKKFQVEENVKVIKLLLALSSMLIFLIFVVIIFIVVPRVYLGSGTYAGQVMISLFDINIALGAIVMPLFSIFQLRKKKELPFTEKIYCINKKRKEIVNPITVFQDATNTYFEQFHTHWH